VTGKNVTGAVKVLKKEHSISLKNVWLPLLVMLAIGSGNPIQHAISFWL